MFSAVRWQLTIVFTLVLVIILLASGVAVYLTTRSLIFDRVDAELQDKAYADLFLLDDGRGGEDHGPGEQGPGPKEFDPGGYFFAIVDEDGQVLESSDGLDAQGLVSQATLDEALTGGEAYSDTESSGGGQQRLYIVAPSGSEDLLVIGRSTESEHDTMAELRTILLAVIAISIVPALAGGYMLSGRVLRPIKAAVDSQQAFIADASHELRTPVAVVRTNAELLERHLQAGTLGQSGDDVAVEDILSESERLGKMVGQMLTLAQADAGQSILSQSDVSVDELSQEVVRSMRSLAEAKGLDLRVHSPGGVWVYGDRERLREVLVTLLDNAIKYTDKGGRVDVSVTEEHRKATIAVSDTGVGIEAESLSQIFTRFYRVDKARSRESGGTGLGLAIAQQIVEAHGGSIRIESEALKGTRITVELRQAAREARLDTSRLSKRAEP